MRIAHVLAPLAALLAVAPAVMAQTPVKTFNYPNGITGVAVNPQAKRAYVLLPNYNEDGSDALQVLDGTSNAVLATYTVPVATAVAVNVTTGIVYVAGSESSASNPSGIELVLVALNPSTGAIEKTIPISETSGFGIVSIAADPHFNKVYIANDSDNVINVVDAKSNTLADTISLRGQVPNTVATNIMTGYAYATLNNDQVAVIEPNYSVTYTKYGSNTSGIAVNPVTNQEYVTDGVFDNPTVAELSSTGTVLGSTKVGLFPQGVAVDYKKNYVFVANEADGTGTTINAKTGAVLLTTTVPANTGAVNSLTGIVYVVGSTTLTIYNDMTSK